VIAPLLVLAAFLGAWQLYTVLSGIDPFVLPAPSDIASSLYDDRSLLWSDFTVTAREMLLGLLCGLVLGLLLAFALHRSRAVRRGVYPLLIASQAVPIPAIAPVLLVWLGFGIVPKLFIVALVCFFPIVVPTADALARVDADSRKLMRTLGASPRQVLRFVEAPAALPGLFTGVRLAVAVAAIAAFLAETSGSEAGLGHLMLQSIPQLETARAFAAVLVLAAFSVVLFGALVVLERRLLPWAHERKDP
jgi:NitT/TauT family transport system permease protein/putative hydroxymethylpyrimidine transport system permease protein